MINTRVSFAFVFLSIFNFSCITELHAQPKRTDISVDSLLSYFGKFDPISVLDIAHDKNINFANKNYYYSDSLKHFTLKWIDRNIYLRKRIQFLLNDYSRDTLLLINILKQKYINKEIDSITDNECRLKELFDSLIEVRKEVLYNQYEESGFPFPPYYAIKYHTELAYPESYLEIYDMWVERGKDINDKLYFYPLLKFGDPTVRESFNDFVNDQILNNGEDLSLSIIRNLRGYSFGVRQLINLSTIDREFDYLSDGTKKSFDCKILECLYFDAKNDGIEFSFKTPNYNSCEDLISFKNEIIKVSLKYADSLEKHEAYWYKEMPFNK